MQRTFRVQTRPVLPLSFSLVCVKCIKILTTGLWWGLKWSNELIQMIPELLISKKNCKSHAQNWLVKPRDLRRKLKWTIPTDTLGTGGEEQWEVCTTDSMSQVKVTSNICKCLMGHRAAGWCPGVLWHLCSQVGPMPHGSAAQCADPKRAASSLRLHYHSPWVQKHIPCSGDVQPQEKGGCHWRKGQHGVEGSTWLPILFLLEPEGSPKKAPWVYTIYLTEPKMDKDSGPPHPAKTQQPPCLPALSRSASGHRTKDWGQTQVLFYVPQESSISPHWSKRQKRMFQTVLVSHLWHPREETMVKQIRLIEPAMRLLGGLPFPALSFYIQTTFSENNSIMNQGECIPLHFIPLNLFMHQEINFLCQGRKSDSYPHYKWLIF